MASLTPSELYDRRRPLPRFAYSILGRLDGTWAEISAFMRDRVLGLQETLDRVRSGRISLARLGDGELLLAIKGDTYIAFQQGSAELQAELQAILKGDGLEGLPLLRCLPGITAPYYRPYWAKYWPAIKPLLNLGDTYGDTSVSREEMFRIDTEASRQAWRSVWSGQDVCFIVGKRSRFVPIPELFDCTASQRTIYSTPTNAYADVPRIVDEVVGTIPRSTLILTALGPAATVLATRLTRLGYWALDIGHITNAYQTVAYGAPRAETTPLITPE